MTIAEALEQTEDPLSLETAKTVALGTPVEPLRRTDEVLPVFVVDEAKNLRGILTPFDLL